MILTKQIGKSPVPGLCLLFALCCLGGTTAANTQVSVSEEQGHSREAVALQLKQAAQLYSEKRFNEAATIYLLVSGAEYADQAAWALELYGVCLEKQRDHAAAMVIYQDWLIKYPDSAGEIRVKQRLLALQTAALQPKVARKGASRGGASRNVYGSASLFYRGMSRQVDGGDTETSISSLSGDIDLHLRGSTDTWSFKGRINGGYLSDQSGAGNSKARARNLYVGVSHEPSGAALTLGRQRSTDKGVYGYFDGLTVGYPVTDYLSFTLFGGSTVTSSRDSYDSDRLVYGLAADFSIPDSSLKLNVHAVEQEFDGFTERRAVGAEVSYFNDVSHYFMVMDYDVQFRELNNLMFNGSWNLGEKTRLALSLGYQRSPFLRATNAMLGEGDIDLATFVAGLEEGTDIYDAALERTALSNYGSLVINRELAEDHRIIGEVYYYQLSELPTFGGTLPTPDTDANTTVGLQYVWSNALRENDALSVGVRYTAGDTSDSAVIFVDEKLRLNQKLYLILRLRGSQRTMHERDQDALTIRPGARLTWYLSPDFMLESELGYEWLVQDFAGSNFEVQQAFLIMGLRKRF